MKKKIKNIVLTIITIIAIILLVLSIGCLDSAGNKAIITAFISLFWLVPFGIINGVIG